MSGIYKSASLITDYLISDNNFDPAVCVSFLQKSLKKKSAAVLESIEGYCITSEQKIRIRTINDHLKYIETTISKLDSVIDTMTEDFESEINLLCTIPGVKRDIAITILAEIGNDLSQFGSSKRLNSWAGLAPGNNESAGKKKSVHVSRAGVYIKPALVQAAHAAVKSNDNPYYKNKYEKISKRRGKKRAIIAIARMILTAVYAMLSSGEIFNPTDLHKFDMPIILKENQEAKAIKQAIELLKSKGITTIT